MQKYKTTAKILQGVQNYDKSIVDSLSDIIVIAVGGVKCQMGVSARRGYLDIVMVARLGAPRWTLTARLCASCAAAEWQMLSVSCCYPAL